MSPRANYAKYAGKQMRLKEKGNYGGEIGKGYQGTCLKDMDKAKRG